MTTVNDTMLTEEDEQEEAAREAYARAVGSRLRAVRKQMRLSLQAVEAMSDQEFKASVLGAYERGERTISVPRLQRLAPIYDVPRDPPPPPPPPRPPSRSARPACRLRASAPGPARPPLTGRPLPACRTEYRAARASPEHEEGVGPAS